MKKGWKDKGYQMSGQWMTEWSNGWVQCTWMNGQIYRMN